MRRKTRIIVSAVLITKDQKILLGKIREGGAYPDCWHIPGGGIDDNESKKEALKREIIEETGIDITNSTPKLLTDSDTGESTKTDRKTGEKFLVTMHFNTYQVDLPTTAQKTQVKLTDDLVDYKWVSLKNLKNFKHTPPSEKLFHALGWL